MKLVILTSDIIDGLIISQSIISSGADLRAIVYEKKRRTLKSVLKRYLYCLKGAIKCARYEGFKRQKKCLIVKAVENINSDATKNVIAEISPTLLLVIGTRKLPKEIFGMAELGAINAHSGILPYYRGADSEFWALVNGEKDNIGVTIHFIDEGLDSGDIVLEARQKVEPDDDHRKLRMKNIMLAGKKMAEAIALIGSGRYNRIKQDEKHAKVYKTAGKDDIERYYGRR